MIILCIFATGWPIAPIDSTHALGNDWGEYQEYGTDPYLHPGIDVMGITIGKPVYAVDSGVVKAWLTTSAEWHWRLAIADYETTDSVEAWLYAHIDAAQYHANVGDVVDVGELIGYLVEWPIFGFDHLHFARIKDAGSVWQYADWAFIQNPLTIITPYTDTARPVFENAYLSNKFAFCQNNTSTYLQPNNLSGNVDIVAKIYDEAGLPLYEPEWEKLIPYAIEYEIHGPQNLAPKISFIFAGILNWTANVNVIYKDDATCNSRGDYDYRDYYFIVTNTDGDSTIESSDAAYSWMTTDFPDGDYWVLVTAYDAAGNYMKDSMLVTVDNVGIEEGNDYALALPFTIFPNPSFGTVEVEGVEKIDIYNSCGQLIASGGVGNYTLKPGIYFAAAKKGTSSARRKLVVIEF